MRNEINNIPYERRHHLNHLDGLRGLAALYIVIHHACLDFALPNPGKEIPTWLRHIIDLFRYGYLTVAIFIVLSGYCLMIPLVQSNTKFLRGGIRDYFIRRSRRILPAYYAVLGLSLLMIAVIPSVNQISDTVWKSPLPSHPLGAILSHLLLIHNFSLYWKNKIQTPLWSVATEWQIYFIFALVLLPVWRRFGIIMTILIAMALGILPHWLFHGSVDGASFEYIGLFALGMGGAELSFSRQDSVVSIRDRIPWGTIALVLLSITYLAKFRAHERWSYFVLGNVVIGLATACFLIHCAISLLDSQQKSLPLVVRLLQSKPCVILGSFSYSLYLIHAPVIMIATVGMRNFHLSNIVNLIAIALTSVPISIIVAYGFYLVFEKPFLAKNKNKIAAV